MLIGLLEAGDAHHDRAVTELSARAAREDRLLLVASAYAEVLIGPMRKGHEAVVEGFVRESQTWVVPIDPNLARSAARLRARHRSLRLGDAFVLACAQLHEAEVLTFDDRLRRISREHRP